MLAVALVEVLPEAFARSGTAAPALVLAGYLAVHLTQHTLTPHFHFGEETHAVNRLAAPRPWWGCCCTPSSTASRSRVRFSSGPRWASWCSSRSCCTSCRRA